MLGEKKVIIYKKAPICTLVLLSRLCEMQVYVLECLPFAGYRSVVVGITFW